MYRSLNDYLKEKFGTKVYKIALSSGCTCPNRDGTIGVGGCIFCGEKGSGDFAQDGMLSITEQLARGKEFLSSKITSGKYIAYFQSFTNTYGPPEILERKFTEAMEDKDVVALSVATRPDCLPQDILEMLERLNRIKPVWVELGLQTIHEETAAYIRRGYSLPVFDKAVKELKNRGIEVVVHVILGLPGESRQQMVETVRYVGNSGANGIKLQLLHVLKNTDLARDYAAGRFEVLSREEYISIVKECVAVLPPDMVIHRLTGDGSKRDLTAPLWSTDKKRVLQEIKEALQSL